MKDLKILFPTSQTATVNGTQATVHALKLCAMQPMAEVGAPLVALMAQPTAVQLVSFCATFKDQIETLLTEQTSLTESQIKALPAAEAVTWCYQVLWANFSFFAEALPAIAASLPDGAEPSKS